MIKPDYFFRARPVAVLAALAFAVLSSSQSAPLTPLAARGYAVIPTPQRVDISGDFVFGSDWRLEIANPSPESAGATDALEEGLRSRFGRHLNIHASGPGNASKTILCWIRPGSVQIDQATDRDRSALAKQAYQLRLAPNRIEIEANASPGLFYGVQTLLQLLTPRQGGLRLPEGRIRDWPDLQMRIIYWDDAHHLEHLSVLKEAIHQAAFFKINGFAIKLEGHFEFRSAQPIVEPYALTPAELQELTDFALQHHVQLIPYLDAPAHVSFILKHPEYAPLREFPESNYEFCVTHPQTYQLLSGMFQDLMDANRGGKYFLLSTDEPYYVGMAGSAQCDESARARELGSVGKLLAEFITKTSGYLHDRGRTVLFWGEFPLKAGDVASLPSYLVNAEANGPPLDPAFKARGIRQMIYTSTQGEEPLFPNYYPVGAAEMLHPKESAKGRVSEMFDQISFHSARKQSDLMGAFVAGWADAGLHPETFWLGYATGPASAWHPGAGSPEELMQSFFRIFYGPGGRQIARVYRLLSRQAQFWEDSWETAPTKARPPIFGNSNGVFQPPRPARDQTLPALAMIDSELTPTTAAPDKQAAKRLELARHFLAENDELLDLVRENLQRVEFHRYNLEVFLTIADLCRQNLEMLLDFDRISGLFPTAEGHARKTQPEGALAAIDKALDIVERIREDRNRVLAETTAVWYKTWFPRVAEANGRRYLNQVDDVKDHHPVRTVDMSYLVYRELLLPLDDWSERVTAARNAYAAKHQSAARTGKLDWAKTKADR